MYVIGNIRNITGPARAARPHLPCCSGAGQILPGRVLIPVCTVDVVGHALGRGPSTMWDDIRRTALSGRRSICRARVQTLNSRDGIQCRLFGVCLHTSRMFSAMPTSATSPESNQRNHSLRTMFSTLTMRGTKSGALKNASRSIIFGLDVGHVIHALAGVAVRACAAGISASLLPTLHSHALRLML